MPFIDIAADHKACRLDRWRHGIYRLFTVFSDRSLNSRIQIRDCVIKCGKLVRCSLAADCLLDGDGLIVHIKSHANFGMSGIVLNGTLKQTAYAHKAISHWPSPPINAYYSKEADYCQARFLDF